MALQQPIRIHALPEGLANQIAAGEVVERPASVLKELIENSLDAGARRITVDIEHGGARLIRVRDDGVGIHRDDLALALHRHATSKIATLDDLVNVASLGFRGEALPSIASVSRLELSSSALGGESGWKLAGAGQGREASIEPVPHPQGTTVTVRDLFYNTPARRKFMRTEKTEYRHLEDVFKRAALARFDCAFSLRHNGRESHAVAAAASDTEQARRVAKLCGAAFIERALALLFEVEGLRLGGWVGEPGYTRGVSDLQYFFINGRMVRDNLLRHAVRHAYNGIVESGRQPAYVLSLSLHPALVDVNVHPSKHEVRFRDGRSVHEFIAHSLRRALFADAEPADLASLASLASLGDRRSPEALAIPASLSARSPADVRGHGAAYGALRAGVMEEAGSLDKPLGVVLEHVERRYVIARNARGLVVVDARRGFRRVAAERLRTALAGAGISARPLLVPVAVTVDESAAERLDGQSEHLQALGFDVRRVALDSVSCRGIPAPLAGVSPKELIHTLADALLRADAGVENQGRLPAVLDAVVEHCDLTATWSWDRAAMNELLRDLERIEDASEQQSGQLIWRQLEADDIAALLVRGRSFEHEPGAAAAKHSG